MSYNKKKIKLYSKKGAYRPDQCMSDLRPTTYKGHACLQPLMLELVAFMAFNQTSTTFKIFFSFFK